MRISDQKKLVALKFLIPFPLLKDWSERREFREITNLSFIAERPPSHQAVETCHSRHKSLDIKDKASMNFAEFTESHLKAFYCRMRFLNILSVLFLLHAVTN